ncbi:CRISPR-associated endonuclease Cas2 [Pyrobaculum neutrophilum]|uniref:CRISPR-associated endoribonuclease Cas2 n=1 Tax=Pyrobaculum neutrophilum (strain DSM 2338 / JCM 9278 / NBRC 100436 / V24Sta) TaxID=444157 RepID=B1YCK6_PYRNV|nr:CRISPR-associated endonuclease Cas2 [Pyrobaculum neutrophilum]ACB39519.1 CRISPR-associated protein Cas2 [Pyrobaculum neutrophilum V24Sta]
MIWLAVYDIEDDGERAKAAAVLQEWGFVRVQRSFYVGRLERGRAKDLLHILSRYVKRGHIALIPVSREQLEAALELGKPPYAPLKPPRYAQAYVI